MIDIIKNISGADNIIYEIKNNKHMNYMISSYIERLLNKNKFDEVKKMLVNESAVVYLTYIVLNEKIYPILDEFFEKNGYKKLLICCEKFTNICVKKYILHNKKIRDYLMVEMVI